MERDRQSRSRLAARARPASTAAASFVICVGFLALFGWIADVMFFVRLLPGLAPMKANTAICFILSGIAIILSQPQSTTVQRRIAQVCSSVPLLIGAMTLVEHVTSWNLGFDELLIAHGARVPGHSARISPATSLNLAFIGSAIIALDWRVLGGAWFAGWLLLPPAALSVIALLGYAYGVESLYAISPFSSVALHTAFSTAVLCFAIASARPTRGIFATVLSDTVGGFAARRLYPAAFLVPFVAGWLTLEGRRADYYGTDFGVALFATLNIAVFGWIVARSSKSLDRMDVARQRAMDQYRRQTDAATRLTRMLSEAEKIAALGSWEWDLRTDSVTSSANGHRLLGLDPSEPSSALGVLMELVHPADRRTIEARIADVRAGRDVLPTEHRIIRPDGVNRFFETRTVLDRDRQGSVSRVVGTWQDITERKQIEHELAKARDAALESSRLKSAFLANMNHEIRTPINVILGYAGLMESEDPQHRDMFEHLDRGCRRLVDTMDEILELSALEAGAFKPDIGTVVLADAVRLELPRYRSDAEAKGLVFECRIDDGSALVVVDRVSFPRVVQCLLGNAVKFTTKGAVAVRVYRDPSNGPSLEIRDTGVGIAPDYTAKIGDPFSQEDPSHTRPFEGAGLGLALVKRYAAISGARLEVESTKNEGSVFTLRLQEAAGFDADRSQQTIGF